MNSFWNRHQLNAILIVFVLLIFDLHANESHLPQVASSTQLSTSNEIDRLKILTQQPDEELRKLIEYAIEKGTDLNISLPGNVGLLTMAIFCHSDLDVIMKLIDHGVDVNKRDDNGSTPLGAAVAAAGLNPAEYEYYFEVVKILLSLGANPNIALVGPRQTSLHICCLNKDISRYEGMIDLLLKGGADPNLTAENNFTALHFAIGRNASLSIVNNLLAFKADPNILANSSAIEGGGTALHLAIHKQLEASLIAALLQNGADPNAVNASGITPLNVVIAAAKRSRDDTNIIATVNLLIKYGADMNAQHPKWGPITKIATEVLGVQHPVVVLLRESAKKIP